MISYDFVKGNVGSFAPFIFDEFGRVKMPMPSFLRNHYNKFFSCCHGSAHIGFQIMFLARLEGAPLSKAYTPYVVEGGATDNAAQKLYLEDYN